jgi:2-iminoacetate synthase
MFSELLPTFVASVERIGTFPPARNAEFLDLLERATQRELSDDELLALVNGTRDEMNAQTLLRFAAANSRRHDREVLLLPPLYFSSICENACSYCSFRTDGVRLTLDQFKQEFAFLVDLGFRSIELVSSQDPLLYRHAEQFSFEEQHFHTTALLPYVAQASQILREAGGGMLTTNIPPLDLDALRDLKEAGLDCFLVWQETFNSPQYQKLHASRGPKGNQRFRLDAMENASAAGIRHLAGAFLKGLYDWRKEEAMLYLFDRYLKRTIGRGFSVIGTPRIKGRFANSRLIKSYSVSDCEYTLNLGLDRILFDGVQWLQTRESFDRNLALLDTFGAGVILTLLSSTAPGGYATASSTRNQFPVHKQDLRTSVAILQEHGFAVRLAWDSQYLSEMQRHFTNN